MCVCVRVFFTLADRAWTFPVIYAVVNPVRGLLDRKRLEEGVKRDPRTEGLGAFGFFFKQGKNDKKGKKKKKKK